MDLEQILYITVASLPLRATWYCLFLTYLLNQRTYISTQLGDSGITMYFLIKSIHILLLVTELSKITHIVYILIQKPYLVTQVMFSIHDFECKTS